MTRALRLLTEPAAPVGWPPAATDRVSATLRWLLASAGVAACTSACAREATASSDADPFAQRRSGLAVERTPLIDLATEPVLDHAASLLDASALLHRRGFHLGAFTLEGIQGRLLEAVLGAGSVEQRR